MGSNTVKKTGYFKKIALAALLTGVMSPTVGFAGKREALNAINEALYADSDSHRNRLLSKAKNEINGIDEGGEGAVAVYDCLDSGDLNDVPGADPGAKLNTLGNIYKALPEGHRTEEGAQLLTAIFEALPEGHRTEEGAQLLTGIFEALPEGHRTEEGAQLIVDTFLQQQ